MVGRVVLARGERKAAIPVIVLAFFLCCRSGAEAQNTGTITGVIKNASGKSVAGALINVRSADSGLGFLVVSQAQGRYSTPTLPPGTYTVQGYGGGYQSDPAGPVHVANGQSGKMDLSLTMPQKIYPPEKRLTNADYVKMMPEGEAKPLIAARCVLCHGLERIVPTREKPEAWRERVDRMRDYIQERPDIQAKYGGGPFTDRERDLIVEYVTKHFSPDASPVRRGRRKDPDQHLPRTLLEGAGARFVAMEFDRVGPEGVHDISVDSRGIAWISEQTTGTGMLGRLDPKTLAYTRIPLPPAKFPHFLGSLTIDAQDHVWLVDRGPRPDILMLQYNPRSGEFQTYEIKAPPKYRAPFNTFRFLDGNLWGAGNSGNRIVKLEPGTGKITEYPVPKGSHPFGLAIGGDKKVWYVAMYDDEVVRLDPNTGEFTHYKPPIPNFGPRRMAADKEGNLWAAGQDSGKLAKVDYRTGKISVYTPPTEDSGPYVVDGNPTRSIIWFAENFADKLGRYDLRTNTFAEFPFPTADARVTSIRVDPTNPNRVWWGGRRIGYVEVME